jgi:glutaminyl-tRNA synthetase
MASTPPTSAETSGREDVRPEGASNFVQSIVEADLAAGTDEVVTRFPPEPNGYLHIGHAKAICVNFGLAERYRGRCNLRFDDTNPSAEEMEFVESIQEDVRWLGFDWEDRLFFASDYFETLYEWGVRLIEKGLAYVCDLSAEETREYRGTVTSPGRDSPWRDRPVEESLDLFRRMREGEFEDGARTLRAKIDMASPNMNLRDPVMYRIMRAHHHRTGDAWCIYPTYDWAHGQSDAIEGITHSVCTLEFENHRPLYEWFLEHLDLEHEPKQIEFARLNLTYAVLSKRKLVELVEGGHVAGWDDPRMPTVAGFRRRGYTPEAIRSFCDEIGVTKFNSTVDMVVLENSLRSDLNRRAPRRMGVLRPVKLVITNYPEESEELPCVNNPEDEAAGTRMVPFSRELWVERDDFRAEAPRKWFRLAPGKEVRLRYAYYVTVTDFDADPETGDVTEIRCTYDPETRGGEVRLYDHLFDVPNPSKVEEGGHFTDHLNPTSLEVVSARLEPSLAEVEPGEPFQLERNGYFCTDAADSRPGAPVLNRAVALRDSWAKIEKRGG